MDFGLKKSKTCAKKVKNELKVAKYRLVLPESEKNVGLLCAFTLFAHTELDSCIFLKKSKKDDGFEAENLSDCRKTMHNLWREIISINHQKVGEKTS